MGFLAAKGGHMSCADRRAQAALDALLLGGLAAEEHSWLRGHARKCESCQEQFDRVGRVAFALEKSGGMPRETAASLEAELLGRLEEQEPASGRRLARWVPRWIPVLVPVAVAAGLALIVLPSAREDGFQSRGGAGASFGVRAFCVRPPQVVAEARSGGKLRCPVGSALQFTYTAPRAARLELVAMTLGASRVFPSSEGTETVGAGVDVPLPFSTPVSEEWVKGPLQLLARFREVEGGEILSESSITLEP